MEDNEILIPGATKEESKSIKAINKETVHKICSGQVVLSLAVAVKELVENAIDAGATLVEVKLRDQGLEAVEVSDNGSGVEESNLEGMTAKYHTSKLREFVDLQSVATFGFRGEALSSLCALTNMTITTRHKSTDVAVKIELDHEGKIQKRQPCARSVGTTVALTNLFETLPVRRRDFVRNIKKEFSKMCQILQAYCLVSRGVRIICSNQTPKGAKSIIVQTHGSLNILENISAVFGNRQINEVLEIKSPLKNSENEDIPVETLMEELQADLGDSFRLTKDDITQLYETEFKLEGFISSCTHGSGRSSKDRQYYYISKLINDCYHRYNVNQYPFVYLNIITDRQSVDVNLTPDKRQLLLNNEKILLALIKKALTCTFGNIPSTYKMQNTTILSMFGAEGSLITNKLKIKDEKIEDDVPITNSQIFGAVLSQWKKTGDTLGPAPKLKQNKRKCTDEITARTLKLQKIEEFLSREQPLNDANNCYSNYKSESDSGTEAEAGTKETLSNTNTLNEEENNSLNISKVDMKNILKESKEYDELMAKDSSENIERIDCKNVTTLKTKSSFIEVLNNNTLPEEDFNYTQSPNTQQNFEIDEADSGDEYTNYTCNELHVTLAELTLNLKAEENMEKKKLSKAKLERLRFKSEISPSQNKNAEAELQKEITKGCFAKMEIVGQFNLGFIIAKLDSDLFIVDQHATDEKYNFETLQNTVQLQHQPLAVAQPLNLTAVNELILIDHLAIFEKNGFKFEIDNNGNAPPTKKVRLLGKPFSKNWEFGKEDIDELIFMLQDAPEGTMCRPSRIRAMFASRACRKSVMIGKALKKSTMETLIRHMGEIEQPWNCPHGRPTMRHLINTAMLINDDEEEEEIKIETEHNEDVSSY
ncbi:hypothetical protein DOY81_000219 [Sarcophaga bullata]|nr:hypothetical protein DOY81_000219 [Sarcophaga bullata]